MVTLASLMAKVMNGAVNVDDPVSKVLFEQFVMLSREDTLGQLSATLERNHFAIVVDRQTKDGNDRSIITGIVTSIDLLNFVVANDPAKKSS